MPDLILKDSDSILKYTFDWAPVTNGREGAKIDWLDSGVTISSYTITADPGITIDSDALTDSNTSVTVTLSGGSTTEGTTHNILCHIVASDGQEEDKTLVIEMLEN